ncbi:MAG: alpha-galactosidase [Thomasclavelia sp.]|nr:alpha-galactosidase [Thomasclavelia sp.]
MIEVIDKQFFHLYNNQISYLIHILDNGELEHVYFGKRINNLTINDCYYLIKRNSKSAGTVKYYKDNSKLSLSDTKQEYPVYGTTDYKTGALEIKTKNQDCYLHLVFKKYKIIKGKEVIPDLPQTRITNQETLIITLFDDIQNIEVKVNYSIFPDINAIVRSNIITNKSSDEITIEQAMSGILNLNDDNYEFIQLSGQWANERKVESRVLEKGTTSIGSLRGASSHQHNPFVALKSLDASLNVGDVYSTNLIYSGNFIVQVDVDEWNMTRLMTGIHPNQFEWDLASKESFYTPEAVLAYSDEGLAGISRVNGTFINQTIINPYWLNKKRPIVLNCWESYYYDFDSDKLLNLAKSGQELGMDCFVVDDGWFASRDNDRCCLDDWYPSHDKFKNGIKRFSQDIHNLGMTLGIWFEPEMINEDSRLYKDHPDWVVRPPKGHYSYGRGQLVLDFANPEVVNDIFNQIDKIIQETKLEYIKWDMNRNITEAYSNYLNDNSINQKEFFHRYILGVYKLYQMILNKYPKILIEGCASGGGRYDLGILYYSPQIWVSDNTDGVERLRIQYGTSLGYPISTMSNHVSSVPNHQIDRITSMTFRGNVAMFGNLGYELDVTKCDLKQKNQIRDQITNYRKIQNIINSGTFFHLSDSGNNEYIWALESKDKKNIYVGYYKVLATLDTKPIDYIKLDFVEESKQYKIIDDDIIISGSLLKNVGLKKPEILNGVNEEECQIKGDFQSVIYHLVKQ